MNGSLVHVHDTKLIEKVQKKSWIQSNFFWIVSDHFGTLFFIQWDSLQWVMWQDACSRGVNKQDAREIFYLLFKFLLFLVYYILQLSYCTVSIIFCWKSYRNDPIRFKWILHIGSERNGSLNRTVPNRTVKKKQSGYSS